MPLQMNWSIIENDQMKPIWTYDIFKNEELKDAFNWNNNQPLLDKIISKQGLKINF